MEFSHSDHHLVVYVPLLWVDDHVPHVWDGEVWLYITTGLTALVVRHEHVNNLLHQLINLPCLFFLLPPPITHEGPHQKHHHPNCQMTTKINAMNPLDNECIYLQQSIPFQLGCVFNIALHQDPHFWLRLTLYLNQVMSGVPSSPPPPPAFCKIKNTDDILHARDVYTPLLQCEIWF